MSYEKNPLNAPGPFYVVNDECMACGAPENEAEGMMSHDHTSQCYFLRQPETEAEVDAAIRATWSSCCGAVRYGGKDQSILTRFAELDNNSSCDFYPDNSTLAIRRDRARFKYCNALIAMDSDTQLRILLNNITETVVPSRYIDCRDFQYSARSAAFTYLWGILESTRDRHSIRIEIEKDGADTFLLKLLQNELAVTGNACWIDKVLQKDPLIQNLYWFSSAFGESAHVRARPY